MGNYMSSVATPIRRLTMKRKLPIDDDSDYEDGIDKHLSTPKRKKLMTTSHYIHKALYKEGQNSDVTIIALGVDWKLHRVYLCQSPYFASMFGGSWKEANDDIIRIQIDDANITVKALDVVFGSLYQDEIVIEPNKVVSVLAAATLFQLESLINQAIEIMTETVNIQTVVKYHAVTNHYGYMNLLRTCVNWLLVNLLGCMSEQPKYLREVSQQLMIDLLSSPELYVMQTEFSTYILLKMWLFLQENLSWDGNKDECLIKAHKYFSEFQDMPYLLRDFGIKYQEAFKVLRFEHLINHHCDVEMLEQDNIIPPEWLTIAYKQQWYRMLRVDQGVDKGPKQISEDQFNKLCFRCGRALLNDGFHLWRWTGYNFGLDILVTYDKRFIKFRRNHRSDAENLSSLSLIPRRQIMYRLTVASIDEQRQTTSVSSTGLRNISLGKNEEIQVLRINDDATFPLLLSANFLVVTPVMSTESTSSARQNGSSTQVPSFLR